MIHTRIAVTRHVRHGNRDCVSTRVSTGRQQAVHNDCEMSFHVFAQGKTAMPPYSSSSHPTALPLTQATRELAARPMHTGNAKSSAMF